MKERVIRVKENTFGKLAALAGKLQVKYRKIMSIDDAVFYLLCKEDGEKRKFAERVKEK